MMIILDTNVASELSKPNPYPNVAEWFARQSLRELYLTCVTEAELRYGLERLPVGRKRRDLMDRDERLIDEDLGGRVLPFDRASARAYAEIRVARERGGRPFGENLHRDCMIAAIARVNGASVATRDTRGFENCGIEVINTWES
jgi:predicted nucleic acid-binding protein